MQSVRAADRRPFLEQRQRKIGDLIHALRVAVTGRGVGVGMFETLAILGRGRCLRRIARALLISRRRQLA